MRFILPTKREDIIFLIESDKHWMYDFLESHGRNLEYRNQVRAKEEQISAIRRDLSVATSDRFTGADAAAMKDIINFKFETLERRLSTIENGS